MESPPSLELMLGPAFLGSVAVTALFGVMVLQGYVYYSHSKGDGWGWRILVSCLCALEVMRLSFILHAMYLLFVKNFGNFEFLSYPTWSMVALVFPGNLVELIVRCVFAHRIRLLCGKRRRLQGIIIPITIVVLSIAAFICGSIFAAKRLALHVTDEVNTVSAYLYGHFSCAMAADFLAAASLCAVLFHSRTGIQRTDSVVRILMAFSFNTGLLTCLCTTACFITYVVWPNTLIWMGLLFPKSQLYVNSLLASLNARESLRNHPKRTSESTGYEVHSLHFQRSAPTTLNDLSSDGAERGLKESSYTTETVETK
ncbi:hypothetical protein CPB83DRAFT_860721 [Crepidotus variabilis]|uniref:DUF6534 domain-containing protein n=1 Tax=Crepidotus variabilis TaxID=179855 RepID=A0A9P6E967_9AGAR|nr:hypothetical protein CPB83DRAFT_860721 [Crepidotus variabilis]